MRAAIAALLLIAVCPSDLWAWTPGTHIALGDTILRAAHLLPEGIRQLIVAFPYDFLYGSIAADTSIAKKYAPAGRHCHSWNVGYEILERARDEPLRSFAMGYLAHLAADVAAHNFYVPHQLAVTSSTAALGHSYWEIRFETHLGDAPARRARELILLDHARSDAHLDRVLSPTIFSTPTNRRIFRGMVRVTDMDSWQRLFALTAQNSRWELAEPTVQLYLQRSFNYIVDLFHHAAASEAFALDPSGEQQLRLAKRVRREALRDGGEQQVRVEAARLFGLPPTDLRYADSVPGGFATLATSEVLPRSPAPSARR